MELTRKQYIEFLTETFRKMLDGEIPVLKEIEFDSSDEFKQLNSILYLYLQKQSEAMLFIKALSEGNLDIKEPKRNLLASNFKTLHSNLKHLSWQAQQVAKGDLSQNVHFLGDFSLAFNKMIGSLREKKKIEEDLRIREEQLRTLNATKDKFFSIIAHDLIGPMGALRGLIGQLNIEYETFSESEKKDVIGLISDSANSTFDLLANLLEWSRQQMNKIPFLPTNFDLDQSILRNVDVQTPPANKKNIRLTYYSQGSIECYGDPNMISAVIRNLISNSVKFTPQNGEVSIEVGNESSFVVVKVKDTGVGISDDEKLKLFRIDVNHTKKGTNNEVGTGLGLILCKEFVEKNGGEISIESEAEKGSTFSFTIPKAKAESI